MPKKWQRPTWLEALDRETICGMIAETFAFLVREHGFRGPVYDTPPHHMWAALIYRAEEVAIRVSVDPREGCVETEAMRLKVGVGPEAIYLFKEAWERGYSRRKLTEPTGSPREVLQRLLDSEAELLREGFPEFLRDDPGYFDEVGRRRQAQADAAQAEKFWAWAKTLFDAKSFMALVGHLENSPYPLDHLWQALLEYARKRKSPA